MTQSLAAGARPRRRGRARSAASPGWCSEQALVMSFADIFLILAVLFAAMVFLVPLVQAPKGGAGAAAH